MADLTVNTWGKILARFETAGAGTQPQHSRQRSERMLDIAPANEWTKLKHAGPCRKSLHRLQTRLWGFEDRGRLVNQAGAADFSIRL